MLLSVKDGPMHLGKAAALVLVMIAARLSPAAAGTLNICAEHYKDDGEDFVEEFLHGQITLPAGTIFDYTGHAFNGAMDLKDFTHDPRDDGKKSGISLEEKRRRAKLLEEDLSIGSLENQHHLAAVTISPVVLTNYRLCVDVAARAFVSPDWREDAEIIFADPSIYFQLYGVVRGDQINTDFDDDGNPFEFASSRGELNATVTKTLNTMFTLPPKDDGGISR